MNALFALLLLAQMPQPFAFVGGGVSGTPGPSTPTPTPTATATPPPSGQVATPVINPPGGDSTSSVTITCVTSGATIFYTLSTGGTNPSHNGATPLGSTVIYHGVFGTGTGTKEIRALGYKSGMTDSTIAIADFQAPGGGG